MYPNTNFLKYFPEAVLPETREIADRSACLRIGAFIVIRKVIAEDHLDEIIGRLIGKEAGLFLDLAEYSATVPHLFVIALQKQEEFVDR